MNESEPSAPLPPLFVMMCQQITRLSRSKLMDVVKKHSLIQRLRQDGK